MPISVLFPTPLPAENPQALAPAASQKSINGADPASQGFGDGLPIERKRTRVAQGPPSAG